MKQSIPFVIILVLAVLLLLSVQRCSYEANHADVNAAALTDTVKHFQNRLGGQTASIKTLQLEKKEMNDLVLAKDKELQQLAKEFASMKSIVKFHAVTQFETINIPYQDPVPLAFERSGDQNKKWYSFKYRSNQNGFDIDSLKTWTDATVITGFKRKWFLGKETVTTDITHSNPYITVTNIKAAEVVLPVPWYKKWYVWAAAGLITGFAISN